MTQMHFLPLVGTVFDLDATRVRHDAYSSCLLGFLSGHLWRIFRAVGIPWNRFLFLHSQSTNTESKPTCLGPYLGGAYRKIRMCSGPEQLLTFHALTAHRTCLTSGDAHA